MKGLLAEIDRISPLLPYGRVRSAVGLLLEVEGLNEKASVGSPCIFYTRDGRSLPGEIVGFRDTSALAMPFFAHEGIGPGCRVVLLKDGNVIYPHEQWLGRTFNGLGELIDGKGPVPQSVTPYPVRAAPIPAHQRALVGSRLSLGIRGINTFLTCCRGQRMGIFAGSGVGKSFLLAQIARNTEADVIVLGLIGERGREVREFIAKELGEEAMKRVVIVVATSDEPALMRRQATYMTLAVAEYFRDQGREVLCLIDSVTRFAMALREIGLAAGEPAAAKGYTPMVFAELPKLLERAGPGAENAGEKTGNITGLFAVLVEGDDLNEPISDTVRGILDGHIVLDRKIAESGRFPAINILKSLSRTMPECHSDQEQVLVKKARDLMASYEDMAEMIRLGAYRTGSNEKVDAAISYRDALENFLAQDRKTVSTIEEGFTALGEILGIDPAQPPEEKGNPTS